MAKNNERRQPLAYLEARFGIKMEVFDDYLLFRKKKSWWILRDSDLVLHASKLKVQIVGLKAFQEIGVFIKPTTRFIQIFGKEADRAIYTIDENDLNILLSGEKLSADPVIDNGYVILQLEGSILGLGLLIDGKIRSQLPRKDLINYP